MVKQEKSPIRIGLVGVGKIAQDQHVPAIFNSERFLLAATASPTGTVKGIDAYSAVDEMIAGAQLDAVSVCTPPGQRLNIAASAFKAGLHVMLEKPPAATIGEVAVMHALAEKRGCSLFASWHSREAAGVAQAAAYCRTHTVRSVRVIWHENIRQWHPGQEWIMMAGGFGVFDPGINALSILTAILPEPLVAKRARLDFPSNRASPIAVAAGMTAGDAQIEASFDFLHEGEPTWSVAIKTDAGDMHLAQGGAVLSIDGNRVSCPSEGEYPALYSKFSALMESGESDADTEPLRLIADLLLIGDRQTVAPFDF